MPWTIYRPHYVQSGKHDTRQRGSDLARRIMMYVVGIGTFPVTKLLFLESRMRIEGKATAVHATAGQASEIIGQGGTVFMSRLWAKAGKSGPHQQVQPGVWSVECVMECDRGGRLSRFTRLSLGWAIVDATICGYDGPTIGWQP
jgi:hypothetical protein